MHATRQTTSRIRLVFTFICITVCNTDAEARDYELTDPDLKVVQIDSSPDESFLSIRADTNGRLFVGGREAVFVYEPNKTGGYQPRQELYRFPKDSWVYDIEIRGNDLYAMTNAALYLLPDARTKRTDIKPKRLIWGHPYWHPHQCFHGLAWGPEGDLYLSMGDILVPYGDFNRPDHWGHWTFFSRPGKDDRVAGDGWIRTPYTGVGGVFRCRPDGSNFQVVARGTRNSCGLVFDNHWNLFTNDNDHEGAPTEFVPGRLLHVTPHADFGWPRGWMPSKTPDRYDLLQTMYTGMGRGVPVGQTYYNEEFLPKKYRHNLLVARWGNRTLARYPIKPRGASFEAEEHVLLQGHNLTRPVGVAVGRGGRIFVTLAYMAHNEGSPVYKSDLIMITRADDPETHPFDAYDAVKATREKLFAELGSASSWRARRAHNELLRRGGVESQEFTKRIEQSKKISNTVHLIWLTANSRSDWPLNTFADNFPKWAGLIRMAKSKHVVLRLAFARAYANTQPKPRSTPSFWLDQFLRDANPQVRHAAIVGLLNFREPIPDALISGPARSDDSYLRQAATLLISRKATHEQLVKLCANDDARTRLAGVLATGFRLTIPHPTKPIPEGLPLQPWPNENVYKVVYATETIDVRKFGRLGQFTVAEHWRAAKHSDQQEALFMLLDSKFDDSDERVRLQAAQFLSVLKDDRSEPLIQKVRIATARQRLAKAPRSGIGEVWIAGPFLDGDDGFDRTHPPESGAVDLGAKFPVDDAVITWEKLRQGTRMFDFRKRFGNTDRSSCYAYFRLESPRRQQAMLNPGSDDGIRIWLNGKQVFTNDVVRGGLPLQDVVYLDLQAGSNDVLIRIRNVANEHNLYLHFSSVGRSVKATLPEKLDVEGLAERLRSAAAAGGKNKIGAEFLEVDWVKAAKEGNVERGRKLFSADGIGCAKCHAATNQAAPTGGPSLAGAGKRFTIPYLVESVLLPNKKISPVFRATLIVTKDGKVQTGLIISESADKINMLTTEAKRIEIQKSDIEERKQQKTSPMPAGVIKKPEELRDILAFLLRGA